MPEEEVVTALALELLNAEMLINEEEIAREMATKLLSEFFFKMVPFGVSKGSQVYLTPGSHTMWTLGG